MTYTQGLFDFIKSSPTAYHTVSTIKQALISAGYTELSEKSSMGYSDGGRHFVIRNGTSVIAFRGKTERGGFMICASHSDSPSFKVTSGEHGGAYTRLSVERYGGMIMYSWLDRPLSVAGRVLVRTEDGAAARLVNLDYDSMVIPSVAIHMNRTVNDGYKFNPAQDMIPLLGSDASAEQFSNNVAGAADVAPDDILSQDLFLYNREEGRIVGINGEYILSPRLDDLGCVYTSLEAFLNAPDIDSSVSVLAVFDNEEVGSETKQGANSTFLDMTLRRIAGSDEKYYSMLSDSLMVSADNAHAKHPNHPELSDSSDAPVLGAGVVVKYNANQRYATDGVSDAMFRILADRAGAKLQRYSNRPDQPGGSTLGSIANTKVSVPTVDIGLPQLSMHSATETVAVSDLSDMVKVLTELYSSGIVNTCEKIQIVK